MRYSVPVSPGYHEDALAELAVYGDLTSGDDGRDAVDRAAIE